MTTTHQQPATMPASPAEPVVEFPNVVAHIEACLARAVEIADRHAQLGAEARQQAERHSTVAMAARVQVKKWERLLEVAKADVEESPEPQAALVVGREPYPPMRYCNGCGTALRPATPDELAAAAAGQMLPDTRHECPSCYREAPESSVWSNEP